MKNLFYKKCLTLSLVAVCILVLNSFSLNAQIRSRDIADSMTAALNGVWYSPNFDQFEVQYPKLNTVPPLSTGMDYETLLSYIYLDSLMRNTNRDMLYMNYLTRWTNTKTKNDTIVQAVKYLYKLVDYDPVRFAQYLVNLGEPYTINLRAVRGWVSELFYNIVGMYGTNSQSMDHLINSDYILKVHVNSIDSLPQRTYPPNKGIYPNKYTHRVNATVIDTLKGKVYKNRFEQGMNAIEEHQEKIQSDVSDIYFTYGTGPYDNNVTPFKIDPTLKNSRGNLQLRAGQDLIVILEHDSYLWDNNYDYFDLSLLCVYPIIEGQVKDGTNVWSNSASLSYEDWKAYFFLIREMLLNGDY